MVVVFAAIQDALSIMPQEEWANSPQNKLLAQFNDAAKPYTMDDYVSDDNIDMDIFESYYSDDDDDDEGGGDDSSDDDSIDANNNEDAGLCYDDDYPDKTHTRTTPLEQSFLMET